MTEQILSIDESTIKEVTLQAGQRRKNFLKRIEGHKIETADATIVRHAKKGEMLNGRKLQKNLDVYPGSPVSAYRVDGGSWVLGFFTVPQIEESLEGQTN